MRGYAVCGCDEVLHDHIRIVEAGGKEIGLIRVRGRIVAFENVCPHQGGPVCQGELLGRLEVVLDAQKRIAVERFSENDITLICPWHGWSYDIATGECITDRKIRLRRRDVVESDGLVYVQELSASPNGGINAGMKSDIFRNADRIVQERGLDKLLIVDSDVHHFAVLKFLGNFMDPPWRELFRALPEESLAVSDVGDRRIAGRLKRPVVPAPEPVAPHRSVQKLVSDLARIGVDYSVIFADDLLALGAHPDKRFQAAVATAYARWLTEFVFPHEPRVKGLLHLPLWDPAASLRLIEEFGGRSGVLGFQITQTGYGPQHAKDYWKIYAALEERGLTLGFHSDGYWPAFPMFDTFLGAHALSFPAFNVMSLINWVWNGMPERFPNLRCVFFEAGAAVIPMAMARLDAVYRMRRDEAPLLTKLPSEYMGAFFYTVQPLEQPETPEQLRAIFARIGTSQILYASDYPHWDFDMPHAISRISFLSRPEREAILALNAVRAFGLEKETLTRSPRKIGVTAEATLVDNE